MIDLHLQTADNITPSDLEKINVAFETAREQINLIEQVEQNIMVSICLRSIYHIKLKIKSPKGDIRQKILQALDPIFKIPLH